MIFKFSIKIVIFFSLILSSLAIKSLNKQDGLINNKEKTSITSTLTTLRIGIIVFFILLAVCSIACLLLLVRCMFSAKVRRVNLENF
uniref:Uncharacterized protein n=1 Tax=Globodera rostochiensis TaxID=31243 RepID=A0A914HN30_GLORO